jgi:hypothetical protein
MKHVPVKDYCQHHPEAIVLNDGNGPAASGLWNNSIVVGDKLVLSSTGHFCLGGVTKQVRDVKTGIYGKKQFINLPGGAIAWWPAGGYLTYEGQWSTCIFHPVDAALNPVPGASYPVLAHVGIPHFPKGSGRNITVGDVTGDGKDDLVITLKDWEGDGYFPGGNRWGHASYRPYEQRANPSKEKDSSRDEALPFWGSKSLAPYQARAQYRSVDGHVRMDCTDIFGTHASDDILCSLLPRHGPLEFSLDRTYRGSSPRACIVVFKGNGKKVLPSIDDTDSAFEYAGTCNLENGTPLTVFADASACVLPGGDLVTVDFVGQVQYFKNIAPGLVFKEMPVVVEHGHIPAIHGCIGTVSMEYSRDGRRGDHLILSGEYGLSQAVKFKQQENGLWIESPDDHVIQALDDHFKEDILVVPSFLDGSIMALGSGAGRYTCATINPLGRKTLAKRLAPFSRLRVQAGPVGSVQGTTEERWGYTCPTVFDVRGDGKRVVISGDISEFLWLITSENERVVLKDKVGKPARVAWRTRPAVFCTKDGTFLVTLDIDNRCTVFTLDSTKLERIGNITLPDGVILGVGKHGGQRGRLKFEATLGRGCLPDLLVGTPIGTDLGNFTTQNAIVARLKASGSVDDWHVDTVELMSDGNDTTPSIIGFGHHCCAPAVIPEQWDGRSPKAGKQVVVGAEDGRLYYFNNPRFVSF